MNANKKKKYFQVSVVLIATLLLLITVPALSFSGQDDETGNAEADKSLQVTMQTVAGKVVETMNSGGYTYALVENEGIKSWVALPKSRIEAGNEIVCRPGMVMNDFYSASLNRTFKHIVFSSGLVSSSGEAADPAANSTPDQPIKRSKLPEPKNWKDF